METFYKVRSSDRQLWYGTFKSLEKAIKQAHQYSRDKKIVIIEVDETGKELTGKYWQLRKIQKRPSAFKFQLSIS